MGYSALAFSHPSIHSHTTLFIPKLSQKPTISHSYTTFQINNSKIPTHSSSSSSSYSSSWFLQKSLPFAASALILISSYPAKAGFLSGSAGIESIPGPQIPQIDFLNRIYEENQKKYSDMDDRFKESPLVKELLERSKLNKEKNKQQVQDKYCLRGAEWGVGDCSADGMSPEDKANFIAMLKKKVGVDQ